MHVKAQGEQAQLRVVAVAAIKTFNLFSLFFLLTFISTAKAAVLPEERFDALYHNYDGGGITIDGPSLAVRKNFADKVSLSANYYVDNISSASIDAITQASAYKEERVQTSAGLLYLHEKSTISYNYTFSTESDYDAATNFFGISQEMFGGLTTVSLGYTTGDNQVFKTGDSAFQDIATSKGYRTSLAQVLTKNLILSLNYDIITDEGFLNNPYRSVRYLDANSSQGYEYQLENYPRTRTSNAASFNLRYYLPYRAVIYGGYRYFSDSWGIKADTFDIGYVHPLESNWTFETELRYYSQTQASFYNDLFAFINAQNFIARDKELSTFFDYSASLGIRYEFDSERLLFFEKGSANFFYNYIFFDYGNFRDLSQTGFSAGNEPFYNFSAGIIRLYFSFWF